MKLRVLIFQLLWLSSLGHAQNFITQNSVHISGFEYNPAMAGIENNIQGLLSIKKYWPGIRNSPVTQNFFIHANASKINIGKRKTTRVRKKPGLGLSLLNDKNGPLICTVLQFSYAYHTFINKKTRLSFGITTQLSQYAINKNKIIVRQTSDMALMQISDAYFVPNFNSGVYLQSTDFYAGLSVLNMADNFGRKLYLPNFRTFYLSTGYKFKINDIYNMESSALLMTNEFSHYTVTGIVKITYKNLVWLRAAYSSSEYANLCFAVNYRKFSYGYGFEFKKYPLAIASKGNHLVFVGFNL